jgi:hypothetical protein
MKTRVCSVCEKIYPALHSRGKKYCSLSCREKDYEYTNKRKKQMQSLDVKGEHNGHWKGGLPLCIDCNKRTDWYYTNRCRECYRKNGIERVKREWLGDDIGYVPLHAWVRRKLGKAYECVYCGSSKDEGKRIHWASISHEAKRDLNDYMSLCASCHKKYDGKLRVSI